MSPTTSTPVFRISVVIAVTLQSSILGSCLMRVRKPRTELYRCDAKSRAGRSVMRGRAAPWFASPDRADRSARIIAQLLSGWQSAPPEQLSVLPEDAGGAIIVRSAILQPTRRPCQDVATAGS